MGIYPLKIGGKEMKNKLRLTKPHTIEDNVSPCKSCKHYYEVEDNDKCSAFPEGIPKDILSGKRGHFILIGNEVNGLKYEPINDKADIRKRK